MEIIISGRHLEIDDLIREHTERKVSRLAEDYPKLTTARVVLDVERNWRLAEIIVTGKNINLEAKAKSSDMFVSVDEAVEKLEKQLRRYLEKIHDHRPDAETRNA